MAADDRDPSAGAQRCSAALDRGQQRQRQLVVGEEHEAQGEQRPSAHGVDVGDRVAGGDRPEGLGVVDERSDDVCRHHQRAGVAAAAHDGRVIGEVAADEDLPDPAADLDVARALGEAAEQLGEVPEPQLGSAASSRDELGQARRALGGFVHGTL